MKKRFALPVVILLTMALLAGCCLSHEWQDATCETPRTCAKCEETEGEALGHEWVDATCETPKTCSVCSKTDGEALGHQMTWEPVKNNYEKMTGICSVCAAGEEADMDWALVADTLILGTWKDEITTVEVLADKTATLELEGETYNFTWNYEDIYAPYEGIPVLMVRYAFNLAEGGYNRGGVFCFQGQDINELTLQIGEARITLVKE